MRHAPGRGLFLPCTLFMAIGLQALAALVLIHLKTTFLFQVTHGARYQRGGLKFFCKARI